MEYRFSLTPRLAVLGLFAALALLVLLFALGVMVGRRQAAPAPLLVTAAPAPAPVAAPEAP